MLSAAAVELDVRDNSGRAIFCVLRFHRTGGKRMYNSEAMRAKDVAGKPVSKKEKYLKYGFVITEHINHYCPGCGHILNAGPAYQPKYCDQCGQRVSFDGVEWKEEKTLGYLPLGQRDI